MTASIENAKNFVNKYPNAHVTFVGHSKGGAEAISNALATDKDAITFNSARPNYKAYGLDNEGYNGTITPFVVQGEILSSVYESLPSSVLLFERVTMFGGLMQNCLAKIIVMLTPAVYQSPMISEPIMLPRQDGNDVANHLMPAVIEAMKEKNYDKY